MTAPHRSRGLLTSALVLSTLPFLLTACSGGGTADASSTGTPGGPGIGAAWGSCMRDAGYDVQDPTDDLVRTGAAPVPEGVDRDRFSEAAGTCSRSVGVQGADQADIQRWEREYAQVASCIRDNGYPDYPEQEPGGISADPETYPRAAEPAFEQAFHDCLAKYSPDTKTQSVG